MFVSRTAAKVLDSLFEKKEIRILMVGLSGAGKSTFLKNLKLGEIIVTNPRPEYAVETVEYKNISFTVYDEIWEVGSLMRKYYEKAIAIVLVVDSSNREEHFKVKEDLSRLLDDESLGGVVLLVLANKTDKQGAMTATEIKSEIIQPVMAQRQMVWSVFPTNMSMVNDGAYQAFDWLTNEIRKVRR